MNAMRRVTQAEFDAFLKAYPRPLAYECSTVGGLKTWCDESLARCVARVKLLELYGDPDEYFIAPDEQASVAEVAK